ncbi:MAG: hypothetical protein HYT80_06990 [Euryarchaeota archaeon]|nr:hypothetical protein [Euryarchaeota archaeon]
MRTSPREDGASAIIGLLVGASVFVAVFGYVAIESLEENKQVETVDKLDLESIANSVADQLVGPGDGWYQNGACDASGKINAANFTPERIGQKSGGVSLGRFGLGEESCHAEAAARSNLSFAKISNIYGAKRLADPADGAVDYDEAVDSLALDDEDYNFHIRSWPVMPSVQQMLRKGFRDPYVKALYIGDYGPPVPIVKKVQHVAGAVDGVDAVTLYVHVTNNQSASTILAVEFVIGLDFGDVDFTLHSRELAPGESQNLTYQIRKTSDWEWQSDAHKYATYTIQDVEGAIESGTISMPMTMTSLLTREILVVEVDKLYFELSGGSTTAKVHYASYDGSGKQKTFNDWTLRVVDGLGLPVSTTVLPNGQKGSVTNPYTTAGTYTAQLLNDVLLLVWNTDVINVVSTVPGPFGGNPSNVPQASVTEEIRYIDAIVAGFQPNVVDEEYDHVLVPYAAGGDVYPDIKGVMDDQLPLALTDASGDPTLAGFNTLFVGSNVDHSAMTSNAAKETIHDWVFAGGTLIVFGSDEQNVQWLEPIFHSALETANGGLSAIDEQHPSLHIPNQLDWETFEYSTEWNYNSGSDEYFTHIVSAGVEGDVLSASEAGTFGKGRVVLSSWRPYDLVPDQASICPADLSDAPDCQAIFLVHNLVTLAYRQLYLDYGPNLPDGSAVGSVSRIVSTYHPDLQQTVTVPRPFVIRAC